MTPLACMVFTKDRPMQMDAFYRSARRYAPYMTLSVNNLPAGPDFEEHVRQFLGKHERVIFHTDDEVYMDTPPPELLAVDPSKVIVTFRQGRNTTYCHTSQCEQAVPDVFPWQWRHAQYDFAYPLSLNACIYRSSDLLALMDFRFANPTQLEAQLACQAQAFPVEWMTAPWRSCTVAIPHNRVTTDANNPISGLEEFSVAALKDLWMKGWRIDLDAMDFGHVSAAHQEIPYVFERRPAWAGTPTLT